MTKKRFPVLLLAATLVLLALGAALLFADTTDNDTPQNLIGRHTEGIGMLTEQPASQTFVCGENGLISLDVMVSTYGKRLSEGTLTLRLLAEDGSTAAQAEYACSDLKNNAFISLILPAPVKNSAGKTFTLQAVSDCTDQRGVTLRMGPAEGIGVLTMPDGTTDTVNAVNLRLTTRKTLLGTMPAMTCVLAAMCCLGAAVLDPKGGREHA